MGIEIRTATPDEYEAAIDTIGAAFLERSDSRAVAASLRHVWDPDRVWLAWDGRRVAGTFRSWATQLTVPGGAILPAAAVAAVTVLPTHRRRGIMSGLAAREHAAIRERGEAVGLLYAAEYPIYGRLGYAPGTRTVEYTVASRATGYGGRPVGTVELVPADATTRDACRAVFEAWRPRQAGEIWRRDVSWELAFGLVDEPWGEQWKGFTAVHRDAAGAVDGYVRYTATPRWERQLPAGLIEVDELHALGPAAQDDLLRFLLQLDLVGEVKLGRRSESERFLWRLSNQRAARVTDAGDALWVRLFDVPRALEARTYERSASLVLEVVDDPALGGTTRVALEAGPGGATCRPTDGAPDLTLPVAALGGVYLGGTRLAHLVLTTGADEHRAGALDQADALFRTADPPWCSTFF